MHNKKIQKSFDLDEIRIRDLCTEADALPIVLRIDTKLIAIGFLCVQLFLWIIPSFFKLFLSSKNDLYLETYHTL